MTLSTFIESTECIRLGWTLLHSVWQLATIAALCGVALMLTQSTARVRYVIAYTSLLLMAAAPIATFALLPPPDAPTRAARLALGQEQREPAASEAFGEHVAALPTPPISDDADVGSMASSEMPPDGSAEAEFGAIVSSAEGTTLARTISRWSAWLVPFWLIGVAVLAVRHFGGWLLSRRMLASAAPLDDALLQARLARLAQVMRLSAPIRILRTSMADVPLIVGWLRPTLLVPVSLMTGLSPEQWDAVLAHELAHIRRHDYAMNLLQIAIETLLFYHPAAWWISRRVRAEREHCCDNVATEVCGNRIALAEALTTIESQRAGAGPRTAVAASGALRDGSTLHRVRRILNLAEPAERRSSAWIIGVAVLLAISTWCVLGARQPEATAVAATEAKESQESDDPASFGDSLTVRVIHAESQLPIEQFLERVETRPAPRKGRRTLHTRDDKGRITTLRLKEVDLAPGDFAIIGQMEQLEWLDLSQTNVSDGDLEQLASLDRLVRLNLFGTKIDGSGLQHLTSLDKLERLNIGDTKLTEDALPHLAKLTSLRHLCLCRNLVNDDGLEHLTPLKDLETLKLGETKVTDASVSTLATFSELRSLTLNETGVTEAGLREAGKTSRLAWIAAPRGTLDEFVRRMTSGDLAGASDMVTIGLLVPEQGTFSSPDVTPHEVTDGDRKRGWHRFQVVFDWRRTDPQHYDGLLFELAIDRGGVFIQQQALVKRGAEEREPESWEITKRYGEGWLHKRFLLHEGLPEKITVPAVEVSVVDADGTPVAGAEVVSHTPRHWVRIMPGMTLHPQPHGSATKTNAEGKFKLPERTEPYRVLVLHESGVADVTHETLLYAQGRIKLQLWSRIEGTAILGGKPLAKKRIRVRPDYSVWSYSTGGPRVTGDINVETDDEGRFKIDKVPPIEGRAFLMRPLTDFYRKKNSAPLSHARQYACQPGKLTRLEMGMGKTVVGSISPMDLGPEQWTVWEDALVWLRHSDSAKPQPVELPREIADLDETARTEWIWDWQLTTPEGRAYSAKRFFLTNQNFYAIPNEHGEFQIDGVPEGTYDLAVRGFRPLGEEQPRSVYYSRKPITVKAPLDEPLRLGGWDVVDAETWRKSQAASIPKRETPPSKVAIHRVVGHKNALPFGRGGNDAEPRRIRFGTPSSQDTRFDAMRPERYPFDGLEYNPTPLISIVDITAYDWQKHEIRLTDRALDRLRRSIKPSVWGVPFVVVVDGEPVYLAAFWTGASSYSANMPTICLDPWVWEVPEGDKGHLPRNAVRIENSQVLEEGEEPSDRRANAGLRKTLDEAGKLIDTPSAVEPEE